MSKLSKTKFILIAVLASCYVHATEDANQVREACEEEVQSYGITDAEDYNRAVEDCIEYKSQNDSGSASE